MDILDEKSNLHGPPDLSPDSGDPGLVPKEGVHGNAVLDNKGGDWYEWQHQHVEDEELLACLSGWIDLVAANRPMFNIF